LIDNTATVDLGVNSEALRIVAYGLTKILALWGFLCH